MATYGIITGIAVIRSAMRVYVLTEKQVPGIANGQMIKWLRFSCIMGLLSYLAGWVLAYGLTTQLSNNTPALYWVIVAAFMALAATVVWVDR